MIVLSQSHQSFWGQLLAQKRATPLASLQVLAIFVPLKRKKKRKYLESFCLTPTSYKEGFEMGHSLLEPFMLYISLCFLSINSEQEWMSKWKEMSFHPIYSVVPQVWALRAEVKSKGKGDLSASTVCSGTFLPCDYSPAEPKQVCFPFLTSPLKSGLSPWGIIFIR